MEYIIISEVAQDFLAWVKDTSIPDETFFTSLNYNPQLGVPGSFTGRLIICPDVYHAIISTSLQAKDFRITDLSLGNTPNIDGILKTGQKYWPSMFFVVLLWAGSWNNNQITKKWFVTPWRSCDVAVMCIFDDSEESSVMLHQRNRYTCLMFSMLSAGQKRGQMVRLRSSGEVHKMQLKARTPVAWYRL